MNKGHEAAGMEGGASMRTGYCRFCGQANYMQASDACTQEQLDMWATEECGCPEGKEERERKLQEDKAERNISKLFGEYDAGGILRAAVHPVALGAVDSVVVNIGNGIKATLKLNKGKIQVMKTTTLTDTMEG